MSETIRFKATVHVMVRQAAFINGVFMMSASLAAPDHSSHLAKPMIDDPRMIDDPNK
jgi:hypothetical protein